MAAFPRSKRPFCGAFSAIDMFVIELTLWQL
jgi:hypothetical protein